MSINVIRNVSSDAVDPLFFGANYLLGRDEVSGTYGDKYSAVGASLIRYPGGELTEDPSRFDPLNPENIREVLEFAADHQSAVSIVLPTKRYFGDMQAARDELSLFVSKILGGEYGPLPETLVFEVGNEFYGDVQFGSTESQKAANYGIVAAEIVDFLSGIIDTMGSDAMIAIQMGRHASDNRSIINAFNDEQIREIDVLIDHDYRWSLEGATDSIYNNMSSFADEWIAAGVRNDVQLFLSEWNVASNSNDTNNPLMDYGLAQASAMIHIAAQNIRYGIDYGAVWAVQQNNRTNLGFNEGEDRFLRVGGETFRMMSEVLPGMRLVSMSDLHDGRFSTESSIPVHVFEDDSKVVVFISKRGVSQTDFSLDLSNFVTDASNVWTETLSFSDADYLNYLSYLQDPANSGIRPWNFDPEITRQTIDFDSGIVSVSLEQEHELVRIVINKTDAGQSPQYIFGSVENESLLGSIGYDTIYGAGGHDSILGDRGNDQIWGNAGYDDIRSGHGDDLARGGSGNDKIRGNIGDDVLMGDRGNDLVVGGQGNDRLYGGKGNDVLSGGLGNDLIFGGSGADIINGNDGNDTISGGYGRDIFIFHRSSVGVDVITDFDENEDILDFSDLLDSVGYQGSDPVTDGYITYQQENTETLIYFNPDGYFDSNTSYLVVILN